MNMLLCALFLMPARSGYDFSLFADNKAKQVGDIVTVIVTESSFASEGAETNTRKRRNVSISGALSGLEDILAQIPYVIPNSVSAEGKMNNEHRGKGKTSRAGELRAIVACKVEEVLPNGYLKIKGEKERVTNYEKGVVRVSGVVRPDDIGSDNTVLSTYIADARISYKGKGEVNEGAKKGFLHRIFDWIF